MKTVKIRVAVAVDQSGDWNAHGGARVREQNAMSTAAETLGSGEARYWLTAELPVPGTTEIAADVTPSAENEEIAEMRYMGLVPLRREGYPIVNDELRGGFKIPREHPLAIAAHHGWPDHTPEQAREAVRLYVESKE
jgi:hypothetical protein